MFTGIVEETGIITSLVLNQQQGFQSGKITVKARKVLEGTKTGDSISVNGICLTVISLTDSSFTADVMPETVRRSSLSQFKSSGNSSLRVNLERALSASERFGGHLVTGHIDGTGIIKQKKDEGNAVWFTISCSKQLLETIVEKGSVALDGISLTVAKTDIDSFSVSVIPHTSAKTTLSEKKCGDLINIETDIIGKYVKKLLSRKEIDENETHGLSLTYLEEMGF